MLTNPDLPDPVVELAQLRAAVARVRALCAANMADAAHGGQTDVDTLWPSDVLAVLDDDTSGCPTGQCAHLLPCHGWNGWDSDGNPVDPRCSVVGCACGNRRDEGEDPADT